MHGLWLIDHPEFLTDAREREDAVRRASWPDHHQLQSFGTRSLIRSKDRPQTRTIKEGETSQVEYDPTDRSSFEDAGERIFDAGDSRQVELAARAQEESAPVLLDGKLKAIWRWHGQLNSPPRPSRARRPRAEGAKGPSGSRCTPRYSAYAVPEAWFLEQPRKEHESRPGAESRRGSAGGSMQDSSGGVGLATAGQEPGPKDFLCPAPSPDACRSPTSSPCSPCS